MEFLVSRMYQARSHIKIQVRCLIDNLCAFGKKKGSGDCESVSGWCRRGGPDQHRANSLNTGRVKVPVKFPALAVVGSKHGLGENAWPPPSCGILGPQEWRITFGHVLFLVAG
jgi:hypothetical protein